MHIILVTITEFLSASKLNASKQASKQWLTLQPLCSRLLEPKNLGICWSLIWSPLYVGVDYPQKAHVLALR